LNEVKASLTPGDMLRIKLPAKEPDMFKDATNMIRDFIATHGAEWSRIINEKSFSGAFINVKGECLKNVPLGYDPLHPQTEYLKNKS